MTFFLRIVRWIRIVSNEIALKLEQLWNHYLMEEWQPYFAWTDYFYQMTFPPKLFALRNADFRDKQSCHNRHLWTIIPSLMNQGNRANCKQLVLETAFLQSSEHLQLLFQSQQAKIQDSFKSIDF